MPSISALNFTFFGFLFVCFSVLFSCFSFCARKADDVPGKIVVDPETLAEQQRGLEKIAQQLRRERLDQEAIDNVVFGFCPTAELWNGR